MNSRNNYRSSSRGKYNNYGKSRQFSTATASTQRDTCAVTIKQGMIITPTFNNEQVARFGFSPILNIIQSAQMQSYVNLYDQVRFQGFSMKLIPSIPNAQ